MKIYGKNDCHKCISLKSYLDENGINYEYIEDFKELAKIGSQYRIMSAPIIMLGDRAYSYDDFIAFRILFEGRIN